MSLLDVATGIVDRARRSEEIEAYVTHAREFSVKAYAGEVEHVTSAEPRGAGVRVVSDGRAGFAYTTDVTDAGIADVVSKARDNSRFATPDEAVGLAPPWTA